MEMGMEAHRVGEEPGLERAWREGSEKGVRRDREGSEKGAKRDGE